MNTRRSTRLKRASPKRKIETDSDGSESNDSNNVITKKSPKRNKPETDNNKISPKRKHESDDEGSSSDSSVGDYLKNPDEIDLSSSFFTASSSTSVNDKPPDFNTIEKRIFGGIQRLSDDDDDDSDESDHLDQSNHLENEVTTEKETSEKINFSQLREYNRKIEEAKACVEKYESSKKIAKNKKPAVNTQEITKLLKLGETKNESAEIDEFEDSDEENEMEWEEIEAKEKTEEQINIPKDGVQITVELPQTIRRKTKGVDMMAAIKRRINRVKKENQVYVHKVHLLCWIAHGNFINSLLNEAELLAPALSLLPSDKCYPPKHADMSYLEQIVKWYGKVIKVVAKKEDISVKEGLQKAISNKTASSTRDFVLIFIIILRSLGLQCRLILSLQCLPLRPPASELCSLSTKETKQTENKAKTSTTKPDNKPSSSKSSKKSNDKPAKTTNKSSKTNSSKDKNVEQKKTSKSTHQPKTQTTRSSKKQTSKETKQLTFPQVDGLDDEEPVTKRNKPSLRIRLKKNLNDSVSSTSELQTLNNKKKKLLQVDDEDFKPKRRSPNGKSPKDVNGNKRSPSSSSKKTQLKVSPKPSTSTTPNKSTTSKSPKSSTSIPPKCSTSTSPKKIQEKLQLNKVKTEKTSPKISLKKLEVNKVKIEKTSPSKASPSSSIYFKQSPKNDVKKDIINLIKGEMSQKRIAEQHLKQKAKPKTKIENSDYDSDYLPDESEELEKPLRKKQGKSQNYNSEDEFKFKVNTNVKRKAKTKNEIDTRVLSSDDETSDNTADKKKKIGNDVWIEVFLEEEEKWISVDLIKGQIHCVSELHSRASQPVSYILAWNNDLSLKDVTARYCPNWNTVTRKLRVDSVWWQESLRPFLGIKNARDKEEDEDLARQQLDKPLPTTISEYKNHPLYALKRHLLKFEAIYPPDALTLGFIRNEAVYARECVHTLHSREIWVKHAKVVKPAQEPYKIVKARPKYDKLTGNMITDLPLELFGSWQVEDYVPPTAENGVVPRNAFGNVELFKACMLPKKTVHLQLPGLNKICRKLRIDCAPAVVGFDFHSGFSHPMFDGYVICEEFKDTVIAAWEQDQIETAKKEQEKYEKRVWGNWRKIIKAALIRERLKARYDFGPVETDTKTKGKKKSKEPKLVLKKRKICSDDDEWTDVDE